MILVGAWPAVGSSPLCVRRPGPHAWRRRIVFGSRCDRRDSNPHGLPHRILSPARLPVPPRSRPRRKLARAARTLPPVPATGIVIGVGMKRTGFTLIELLVVVAIIGLVA